MNPDDPVRVDKPADEEDPAATKRVRKQDAPAAVSEEQEITAAEPPSPEPVGWAAQIRQAMQRSPQGEARTNIKRQQLREDRTKAFLMLAGSTVVLGLMFFALFSSPSSSRKSNSTRPNEPHLGRGPAAETDTSHSVTPLLNADTRTPDGETENDRADEPLIPGHNATCSPNQGLRAEQDSVPGRTGTCTRTGVANTATRKAE